MEGVSQIFLSAHLSWFVPPRLRFSVQGSFACLRSVTVLSCRLVRHTRHSDVPRESVWSTALRVSLACAVLPTSRMSAPMERAFTLLTFVLRSRRVLRGI